MMAAKDSVEWRCRPWRTAVELVDAAAGHQGGGGALLFNGDDGIVRPWP